MVVTVRRTLNAEAVRVSLRHRYYGGLLKPRGMISLHRLDCFTDLSDHMIR
jgi:hypothetical protein